MMTEQAKTKSSALTKIVIAGLAFIVVCVIALVLTVVSLGAAFGGSSDAGATAPPACIPGDTPNPGVAIPAEYQGFVDAAAAESGFSASVIGAQLQHESSWNPLAESPVGAGGLAQFMPPTWAEFGNGGDIFNPEHAIAAQGRYMKYLSNFMKDHAADDENLLRLALAGYNAGQGAVSRNGYDLEALYDSAPGYRNETAAYVDNIVAAASGNYTSDCGHGAPGGNGGPGENGSVVDAAAYLAWEHKVTLPFSAEGSHGRAEAKPEFVEVADGLSTSRHTAYYTDCGVFVASAMISSGTDKSFPKRSTGVQLDYLRNSSKYDFFKPQSEAELEPGDILITPGHIFLYTGERNASGTGRAQGASLYTRPPSGHDFYLTDNSGRTYYAARHKG